MRGAMAEILKRDYDEAYYADLVEQTSDLDLSLAKKLEHWFAFVGAPLDAVGPSGASRHELDAGCGTGTVSKFLVQNGYAVTALDGFEIPLRHVAQLVPEATRVLADLNGPLPFPDASFDLIVSYEVIEHLPDPRVFVGEAFRLLRPGGQLVLKCPNRVDWYRVGDRLLGRTWYADEDKTHLHYFDAFQVARFCRRAGFAPVTSRAGTKPFFRKWRRWRRLWNPRLPLFGSGVAARAVKP